MFRGRISRAAAAARRATDTAALRARKMARRVWGIVRGATQDRNARELDDRFLLHGATLIALDAVGDGVTDRLVGYREVNVLVEYKNVNGRGRVADNQKLFAELWRGARVFEAWNVEDVEAILAEMRKIAATLPLPYQREAAQ